MAEQEPRTTQSTCTDITDVQKFSHLSEMASFLNSFRVNDSFCDMTITLQNRTFRAHKNVLASASAYFRAMFLSGYSESTMAEVTLKETPDLDGESFATLLDFMYTGELRLSLQTVPQTLACASYLQIKHATQACVDYINQASSENKLSFADFIRISSMTASYDIDHLKETANSYISMNFAEFCKTEAFAQHMTYQHIYDLLDRTDLLVSSETEVFDAVLFWFKHDWEDRKIHCINLLGKIRLGLLPLEKISEKFENQLHEMPECKDLYVDILKYYAYGKKAFVSKVLADKQDDMFTPRDSAKGLVAIGMKSYVFEEDSNSMGEIGNFALAHGGGHSVAVVNGELYCAGGQTGTEFVKYDNKENKWISLPAMNTSRSNFGFLHDQGYLYAIGGVRKSNPNSSLYGVGRYDIASGKWQNIAPMFSSDSAQNIKNFLCPPVAKYKDRIFISGYSKTYSSLTGLNEFSNYVMMFNPYSNMWYSLYSQSLGNQFHKSHVNTVHLHVLNINETLYLTTFSPAASKYGSSFGQWQWSPTVYKCECDVGSEGLQPTFTLGNTVDQKCIPETNLKAFRIGNEVYIILGNHVHKTRVVISDGQIYDSDLSAYSALESVDSNYYAVTNFSFSRKLIK